MEGSIRLEHVVSTVGPRRSSGEELLAGKAKQGGDGRPSRSYWEGSLAGNANSVMMQGPVGHTGWSHWQVMPTVGGCKAQ